MMAANVANAQAPSAMDKKFMKTLCQGNHAEIAAGKIALKNSQDEKVRGVAQTIINEHTANDQKLHTLASKFSVKLPNGPDAKHKTMARKLATMRGNAFDNAYISGQMKDHGRTISLLRMEMEKGKNSEVRSFATETLGAVLAHNDTIHKVSGSSANKIMSHNMGGKMSGTSSAVSSSKPMNKMNKMSGSKMNGSMAYPKPITGSSFTPAPRTSPIPSASPAPGIN
ncbi:MAG: DUF4142 domain-containing protein [Fibrella sp.]|nr:DUF4142 domain-containing protein [Armatimonadota bacterium]